METAIRWSNHSTATEQQFLNVDVSGRKFHLCRVTSSDLKNLTYETIATHTRVPAFRAFDWSPANPALVAVGQSSGESTVLRIDDNSEASITFPIRSQRLCNAVALSSHNLLAVGLDKVRNDFCLNIWDLNQRVPNVGAGGIRGFGNDKGYIDPYAKLASSEPITSIKFFADQPQTLVAGVKAQFVRLYDIREPHGQTALQFSTRCVHNIAIDPCDENYIASCLPNNDPTVCVWDRRAGNKAQTTLSFGSDSGQTGPSLELKNVADFRGAIWSLRFAKTKRGCLGMLTSTGQFKAFDIGRDHPSDDIRRGRDETLGHTSAESYPEDIFIERMQEIERPFHVAKATRAEKNRIVSFDFITHDEQLQAPGLLTLAANGTVEVFGIGRGERASTFTPFAPSSKPFSGTSQSHLPLSARLSAEKGHSAKASHRHRPAQSTSNPMLVFRERCEKGYQFDTSKNRSIVSNDRTLSRFWRNVDRATSLSNSSSLTDDTFDFSYLGVHGIWMEDLGQSPHTSRKINPNNRSTQTLTGTTESLVKSLKLQPLTPSPQTSYMAHRQLCLYVSGLQKSSTDLENDVRGLRRRHPTEAAAIALFASEPKLATRALRQKSSTETHKMLAMAIASSQSRQRRAQRQNQVSSTESDDSDSEWEKTLTSLLSSVPPPEEDPYAHAIIHTIIHGTPAHPSVISNPSVPLPLSAKLNIAIHHLSDTELTAYISDLSKSYISKGLLDGIILTGLGTPGAVSLFSNYISQTGDVQTAVLALTPVIPRYVSDPSTVRLFESWRDEYRSQMQIWDMKFQRVKFDVAGRKLAVSRTGVPLIPPKNTQISITCTYCQQSVAQIPPPAKPGFPAHETSTTNTSDDAIGDSSNTSKQTPGPVATKVTNTRIRGHPLAWTKAAAVGTICPKCGRGLPRCGICELPLGMPDPSYVKPLNHPSSNKLPSKSGTLNGNGPISSQRGSVVSANIAGNPTGTTNGTTHSKPSIHTTSESGVKGKPSTDAGNPNSAETSKPDPTSDTTIMSKFITFCISCGHGFHALHAREWFGSSIGTSTGQGHRVCPVPDCGCICDRR